MDRGTFHRGGQHCRGQGSTSGATGDEGKRRVKEKGLSKPEPNNRKNLNGHAISGGGERGDEGDSRLLYGKEQPPQSRSALGNKTLLRNHLRHKGLKTVRKGLFARSMVNGNREKER